MRFPEKFLFCLFISLVLPLMMSLGISMPVLAENPKSLLIINSYNENEPWVNDMIQPLIMSASLNPDVQCEVYDLNNALMVDSVQFADVTKGIMSLYSNTPPSYVVMIGNLAFNMRDAIKASWGDLPMLLITPIKDYAQIDEYFRPGFSSVDVNTHHQLMSLRDEYNMTAIIIPQYYKQTIDMMVGMIPDMDALVFMSDSIYVNRKMAHDIQNYLREEYPEVKFSWLKANADNARKFHKYLVEPNKHTGYLLSTWLYGKHELTSWKSPSTSDLKLIASSKNPIFTLHEAYITLGVLGGVFPAVKLAQDKELEILNAMFAGMDMREIPFFICEDSYPCVNYRLLKKYGIKDSACPEGTVFYSKPPSFWDKYLWQTIALILLATAILLLLGMKTSQQRKKIANLKRNSEFVDNMPIPYSTARVRYDSDNNVTNIAYSVKNAAFEKILNDNVVPESPYLLFPAQFIAPKVTQLLKNHKPQIFVYHFDKTDTYYEFILCLVNSQMKTKDKNVQSIDIFAIDITNRHKMERRLDRAMRTLDITINAAKLVPWQYDVQRNVISYDYHLETSGNGGESRDKELPFDEFVDNLIHPDDRNALRQVREDVRHGRIKDFTIRLRRIDPKDPGSITWEELVGAVTTLDDERKQRIVIGSSLDITDRVRNQQDMARALERANESDRMKSAFLASMSHEIRTPLNAIVGFSNVMAHTEKEEDRIEFADIINRNNEQLLALINDVLDLAKIESNTIDINYEETDVNALIDHVQKTMAIKVPKGLRFTAIKGCVECIAELDGTRVMQILNNMIANSCKFTPSGSITFGYDITDTGMICFYVRDTGIGISKENKQKVFDRFYKLNTFIPGTGLGLSICKNLAEKMGGEIGVESSGEGKGSMFWFTVPYVPCNETTPKLVIEDDNFFKRRISNIGGHTGRNRLKVLIAEDNDSNSRLLAHLLHDTFDIVYATNGGEAVRQFIKEEPDVVLLDISMPGIDGYGALKEIRKFSTKVPIIAVTAYVYASDRQKILDFGFDGYVSKPISQKTIIDAIGHALLKDKGNK